MLNDTFFPLRVVKCLAGRLQVGLKSIRKRLNFDFFSPFIWRNKNDRLERTFWKRFVASFFLMVLCFSPFFCRKNRVAQQNHKDDNTFFMRRIFSVLFLYSAIFPVVLSEKHINYAKEYRSKRKINCYENIKYFIQQQNLMKMIWQEKTMNALFAFG